MACMNKGWVGGMGMMCMGSRRQVIPFNRTFGVALSPRSAIVIGPDKLRGPKRRLTNAGVNIRPIPPI